MSKTMVPRLGVILDTELEVWFFRDDRELLRFISKNDPLLVGQFMLEPKTNTRLDLHFARHGEDLPSISVPAAQFPKELEHFDWFPKEGATG